MRFWITLLLLIPTLLLAEKKDGEAKRSEPEIVRSEDYSVRRFQEVLQAALKARAPTPQEELILLRAKLILSEKRWSDLKEIKVDPNQAAEKPETTNRVQMLRAAQAEMNHYQTKIARLEDWILREKRKEREAAQSPKKSGRK